MGGKSLNLDVDQGGPIRGDMLKTTRATRTSKVTVPKIWVVVRTTRATSMLNIQHCVVFVEKTITVRIDAGMGNLYCVSPVVVQDTSPSTIVRTRKLVKRSRPTKRPLLMLITGDLEL